MKQPTIIYEGGKIPVESLRWNDDGVISYVSFMGADNAHHVAFRKGELDIEGYNDNGILHMDLEKALAHNLEGDADAQS